MGRVFHARPPHGRFRRHEWDQRQLRHIAEIARRVPTESVAAVAKDFWRRGIKDRQGRPWGKPRPKPFSLFCTPYQGFYRAVRWFHRMKWKGLLPAPYDGLAASIPEPNMFWEEPRPKGWTRGGTARREQGRRGAEGAAEGSHCQSSRQPGGKARRVVQWFASYFLKFLSDRPIMDGAGRPAGPMPTGRPRIPILSAAALGRARR